MQKQVKMGAPPTYTYSGMFKGQNFSVIEKTTVFLGADRVFEGTYGDEKF